MFEIDVFFEKKINQIFTPHIVKLSNCDNIENKHGRLFNSYTYAKGCSYCIVFVALCYT